ncbi:hypothetical protein SAY87_017011 [Trapa incisa]|uniref:Uncharacterized protein n=1 Tax=Trapa incisa TaxID=236973 RepID=A0AAN7QYI8_9MYRT|nr:hypothetical protein SAY87_017011 [Trapa incisa]
MAKAMGALDFIFLLVLSFVFLPDMVKLAVCSITRLSIAEQVGTLALVIFKWRLAGLSSLRGINRAHAEMDGLRPTDRRVGGPELYAVYEKMSRLSNIESEQVELFED